MLNEFRNRYPNGSLISELLEIAHGKYIVRVSVHIEGVTVATGLAAADTIEVAEDQARVRAIALLNLEPLNISETPATNAKERNSKKTETVITSKTTVKKTQREPDNEKAKPAIVLTIEEPEEKAKPPIVLTIEEPDEPISEPEEQDLTLETKETFSDTFEPEDEETPVFEEETTPLILETEEITTQSPEPSKKPYNEPMDYTEVIDRTSVEMKRLGWTNDQGKEYLISTYGKRSRQLLDDQQLIEFLQYLESLPTP
ncbi:hypothetical protein C7H19_03690 [Aphanothece hegewaldii CCALA 016]|uniref:Uncharacterized protein n=1 Tax=Aphanothece hegewaldii CCALA 016 TaxID=2107694 RepID=A0A2T1M1M6_9CHRO|nr:hypothetical protein [Aphanothece hegewaldii]PSF38619.1 hypothetical protein C7H19_03690 [Aphanothece hegewaldii CCALA 016]